MRSLLACCAMALVAANAAGAGRAVVPVRPAAAAVSLSTSRAGARPVTVTVELRYDMQCARPGPGPLVLTFPAAEQLPAQLASGDVLVDGHPTARVERNGRSVSIALPIERGPLCDVIAPGVLKVVFVRDARLGNPPEPGTYALVARTPRVGGRARMTIR